MRNQIMSNGTLLQTIHHFSGVMNQDAPENALLRPDSYGTAQMVVVKKTQGNTAVQAPPKIPEVILEAKKAMQTEVMISSLENAVRNQSKQIIKP